MASTPTLPKIETYDVLGGGFGANRFKNLKNQCTTLPPIDDNDFLQRIGSEFGPSNSNHNLLGLPIGVAYAQTSNHSSSSVTNQFDFQDSPLSPPDMFNVSIMRNTKGDLLTGRNFLNSWNNHTNTQNDGTSNYVHQNVNQQPNHFLVQDQNAVPSPSIQPQQHLASQPQQAQ